MKICLISNLFPPYNRGGAEQVVKNTVEGLLSRGHEVVVITARPLFCAAISSDALIGTPVLHQDNKPQILNPKIYHFFPFNLFFYGNDYKYPAWLRFFWHIFDVFNLYSYFVIRRILKKEKPDIVHTHNLKGLGYLIPRAIRSLGLRHAHTLHDVQLVEPSGIIIKGGEDKWPYNFFLRKWYEKINCYLFGSPDVIISPSKFLMEFYEKRGFFPKSKKVVVPNPVTEVRITKDESRVMNQGFNFLYVGQIEAHKGVLFLIETFKKLIFPLSSRATCPLRLAKHGGRESRDLEIPPLASLGRNDNQESGMTNKNIFLRIVGSGSKLEEAERSARDCPQIIFYGRVDRVELPNFFSQTNLTIVPSLCYENSPTVIFESFSYGVPVLASSIEGVAELIRNGENGLTFEAGQEASLTEKMLYAVENNQEIEKMREAALKSIEGRGLDEYLDKLLNLCYNI